MATKVYKDIFKVTFNIGDKYVCTAQNENETLVHRGFLFAHGIDMGNCFVAEVDYRGRILIDTIKKI